MALDYFTGFEHGITSLGWDGVTGTPSLQTSVVRSGTYAAQCNAVANQQFLQKNFSSANAIVMASASFYFSAADATNAVNFMVFNLTGGGQVVIKRDQPSGNLTSTFWSGTADVSPTITSYNLALGHWYWIQMLANVSANPWTLDVRVVDDTEIMTTIAQNSGAVAATTAAAALFGISNVVTANTYVDDPAIYINAVADGNYPQTARTYVQNYSPAGVGTHNLDAATSQFFFKNVGGTPTALTTSETLSYQAIDDIPLDSDSDRILIQTATGAAGSGTPAPVGTPGALAATGNNVSTPNTLTPSTGSGYAVGDLLLCFTACRSATPTVATPAGWTPLINITGTNGRLAVFGKIATSTSEAAPSVTWSTLTTGTSGTPAAAIVAAFTQAALTVDVAGTIANGAASTATSAGGSTITTLTNNDLVLALTTRLDDAFTTFTAPAGFTNVTAAQGTTSGADFAIGWAYQVKATAGSVTAPNFGLTGASSFASSGVMLSLKSGAATLQPTTTEYAEYVFNDDTEIGSAVPQIVKAIIGYSNESGTAANSFTVKLAANASESNIFSGSIGTTTTTFLQVYFPTAPGGAAWTKAIFDGATLRLGYTNNVTVNPSLESAMLEVLYPVTAAPPPVIPTVNFAIRVAY
jgi:hypothetical protein